MFGSRRASSEVRQQQIVEATLDLLAQVPLDQLSTRQIARSIGVSQPALFRHFRSRDDLLLAVIASSRTELAKVAESILSELREPSAQLEALARQLLRHLDRNPGLVRLMFANVASGNGPVLGALRQLHSMQMSLVAELVRQGQREGAFDRSLDARDAATLFGGFLQGLTLTRRLEPSADPLEIEGRRLFALWLNGIRAGVAQQQAAPLRPIPVAKGDGLRVIDVRPLLARGTDPLDTVLEAVAAVGPGGVVKISAPFRPAPLIALLSRRGHAVRDAELGPRNFTLEIVHGGQPEPEDLRELEPPEPLERVLGATAELAAGGVYLARLPRHPWLLFPHLRERGLEWCVHDEPDGTALLRVYKPGAPK
jgi:TetR/AcrR family transcriptional regulator